MEHREIFLAFLIIHVLILLGPSVQVADVYKPHIAAISGFQVNILFFAVVAILLIFICCDA